MKKGADEMVEEYYFENQRLKALINDIKGALNTEENGAALVEVARNAHRMEMAHSAMIIKRNRR